MLKELQLLHKSLAAGKMPAYLIVSGKSGFLLRTAVQQSQHIWCKENNTKVIGLSTNEGNIHELLQQRSLFAASCLYLIPAISSAKICQNFLRNLAKKHFPFVITLTAKAPDSLKKNINTQRGLLLSIEEPTKDKELVLVVKQIATSKKVSLTIQQYKSLINYTAGDLDSIDQALAKISLYSYNCTQDELDRAFDRIVGGLPPRTIFILEDLILGKKKLQAYQLISELYHQGENSFAIISIIARIARIGLLVSDGVIDMPFYVPDFQLRKYRQHKSMLSPQRLVQTIHACHDAEIELKSSTNLSQELVLTKIIDTAIVS